MGLKQDFEKELYAEIKRVAKINNIKYTPSFHGIYMVNEDYLWRVQVIAGFLYSNNTIDVTLRVSMGATCFDDLLASIVNPNEDKKITALQHAAGFYVGPSMLLLDKNYFFQLGAGISTEKTAINAADLIVAEALKCVLDIEEKKSNGYPDMVSYMLTLNESNPMECGMAHLYRNEYQSAKNCFIYAVDQNKIWHISYGQKARLLHLILIDYCDAKLSGIEWKDDYVIRGLEQR